MEFRQSVTGWVGVLLLLAGCGGGTNESGGTSGEPSAPTSSATSTIDPDLQRVGGVPIAAVQSLTDEKPVGSPISFRAEHDQIPLWAVDRDGSFVLAAYPSEGRVTFTAESTVQILSGALLASYLPDQELAVLEQAVRQAAGFADAVEAFTAAHARGINPPADSEFKARVRTLISQALHAHSSPVSIRSRPLAVPTPYLDPTKKLDVDGSMVLLRTTLEGLDSPLSVRVANQLAPRREFVAWNATPIYWDVATTKADGTKAQSQVLEPPDLFLVGNVVGVGQPLRLNKEPGAFGLTLQPSPELNAAKLTESILNLAVARLKPGRRIPSSPPCKEAVQDLEKDVIAVMKDATATSKGVYDLLIPLLTNSPSILKDCLLIPSISIDEAGAAKRINKYLGWIGLAIELTKTGLQAGIWLQFADKPVSVGVCVTKSELVMACVHSIANAYDPPPIAVGSQNNYFADSPLLFYDGSGTPTGLPADLSFEYDPLDLKDHVEMREGNFDSGRLSYSLHTTGHAASGSIRVHDRATDKSVTIPIKVSTGRLSSSSISITEGETREFALLEQGGDRPLLPPPKAFDVAFDPVTADAIDIQSLYREGQMFVRITGKKATPTPVTLVVRNGLEPGVELARADVDVVPLPGRWEITYTAVGHTVDITDSPLLFNPASSAIYPFQGGGIQGRIILGNSGGDVPGHIFEGPVHVGVIRTVLDVPFDLSADSTSFSVPVAWRGFVPQGFASVDDVVNYQFLVTARDDSSVSGTFTSTMSQALLQDLRTTPLTGYGTWSARRVQGSFAPLRMNGHDFCIRGSAGVGGYDQMSLDMTQPGCNPRYRPGWCGGSPLPVQCVFGN